MVFPSDSKVIGTTTNCPDVAGISSAIASDGPAGVGVAVGLAAVVAVGVAGDGVTVAVIDPPADCCGIGVIVGVDVLVAVGVGVGLGVRVGVLVGVRVAVEGVDAPG